MSTGVRRTVGAAAAAAVLAIAAAGTAAPGAAAGTAATAASAAAVAQRWAPVHHQDVDQTGTNALGGRSDYIAAYDFDGDLDARNNWEHTGGQPLAATAYYSVLETSTHWFVTYMFFHPRDWSDSIFDTEHENDAEGVMVAVQKDGSPYGVLRAAVTVAHRDFYSWTPQGSTWGAGGESLDGTLPMVASPHDGLARPATAQEAKGHGLKARGGYDIVGDGVVYHPGDRAEVPEHPDDRDVSYRLVDVHAPGGLWAHRADAALFASPGTFAGDASGSCGDGGISCTQNSANAPWGWDDGDDVPGRGALATDPAGLVASYFRIPEPLDRAYVTYPF
ncbi:hypothetical protein ACFQHV_02470 [Promicromonospora thailandica]|uniref:Uncharacterized protein n=1 Tax=Promicromonospora thailandica TaxID=765201 RepID=A0A9X2JY75_9MICO|nr:hypothetical protein [Promicromonospora thailandica]MCP2266928.1 hypothetical protein [Promicromonospora thailandica]BFF16804.1 hypothetical protein GCM10025730_03250 [Promicromonospora thailandica]